MIALPRLRRWMLAAAPVLALPGRLSGGGLMLWMAAGACLFRRKESAYSAQKRPVLHRLFFAWSLGCVCHAALGRFVLPLLFPLPGGTVSVLLASLGQGAFSCALCERGLNSPVSSRRGWIAGGILACAWLLLT